jgi:uncharacterized membrane protein
MHGRYNKRATLNDADLKMWIANFMPSPSSPTPNTLTPKLAVVASVSLISLIFLCLGWELWWAPLRPGGSLLVLKAVLLLLPLRGVLKSRRYTLQWTSLFLLFYLFEGSARSMSDQGLSQQLAMAEFLITTICFTSIVAYLRITRPAKIVKEPQS